MLYPRKRTSYHGGEPIDRRHRIRAPETPYHRLVATLTDPDLIAVVTFCVLGLLIALNVILRFPDLGALIEQYNQF
jgi:hypothetical protein